MSQRHKNPKNTKINIKGKTMHPTSTKYPKMVKHQHRDVQKNKQKNNTFFDQNQILKVVPVSQKSNEAVYRTAPATPGLLKIQLQQRPSQIEQPQTLRNPINSIKLYPVVQEDRKLMGKEEQVTLGKITM